MTLLTRSVLTTPATSARLLEKAAASDADAVMIDLEDAVSPSGKDEARSAAIQAVNELDWGRKRISCRVNGSTTPWGYADLEALALGCGGKLHAIVLPKVLDHHDVIAATRFLRSRLDLAGRGAAPAPELHALIEDARAFAYVREIVAQPEIASVTFGVGDFSATLGVSVDALGFGSAGKEHGGPYQAIRSVIAVTAKGHGVSPIDTPFPDYGDPDGFAAEAKWASSAGFDGKWCIHPNQIALANEIFSPTAEQFATAEDLCRVYDAFVANGNSSALEWRGKMIDEATVRMARETYERGVAIGMGGTT